MKYLKNVLLAASLVVTTMGMSLSANAALIQQDIFIDVVSSDDTDFGIIAALGQLLGSVMYDTDDANGLDGISLADTSLEVNLGALTLTDADVLGGGASDPILLSANPEVDGILNFIVGIEFLFNGTDFALELEADRDFIGSFILYKGSVNVASGETRLGQVTQVAVSEPSALILMLAGFGFLVRRKIAAK